MTNDAAPRPEGSSAPEAAYRGFLFSDLRGFTAFTEHHGNAAVVELLDDYRGIVRGACAKYGGAEIKVEGDSYHVVFPSASSAVLCGLAIVHGAAEASAARPDRPIEVGVGVHAGEAIETSDGYIGSAVNVASRVCAIARSGEVLVTSTVRGITQASIPVGFVPRGRRRLKGIADPVEVFAVTDERVSAAPMPRRRAPLVAAAVVGVVGVLALGALVWSGLRAGATSSPSQSPSGVTARPVEVGPLGIGPYASTGFEPPLRFVISDPGWAAYRALPDAIGLHHETEPIGNLDIAHISALFSDACIPENPTPLGGPLPIDLLGALGELAYLEVVSHEVRTVNGRDGLTMDLIVADGAMAACGGFGAGDVALFPVADDAWRADPGERFRLVALDVEGRTVAFVMSGSASPAGSVPELETFFALADRIIASIES